MNRKFLMLLALIGLSAGAVNAQTSGMCGDSLTWTLTGTKSDLTLTISGTGDMYNYAGKVPWRSKRKNIKTLVLHEGMTSIGNNTFIQCKITSLTIPNSVTYIGYGAFFLCRDLTSVTIPNSVTTIRALAFAHCGLTSVTIPNSVTAIGMEVFVNNNFTSLTIPNSITEIGKNAFLINRYLTDVYVSWSTPPPVKNIFDFNNFKNATLHIPQGALAAYQSADLWKSFLNIVEDVTDTE